MFFTYYMYFCVRFIIICKWLVINSLNCLLTSGHASVSILKFHIHFFGL